MNWFCVGGGKEAEFDGLSFIFPSPSLLKKRDPPLLWSDNLIAKYPRFGLIIYRGSQISLSPLFLCKEKNVMNNELKRVYIKEIFSVFRYSHRNTSRSLGETEVGTQTRRESVSTLFRVLPNSGKNVFYFFHKITRKKLKCRNSLLIKA